MIQITSQMRVLVAIEPADFRCGIDGLARVCRSALKSVGRPALTRTPPSISLEEEPLVRRAELGQTKSHES